MVNIEVVGSKGGGGAGVFNGALYKLRGEEVEAVVEGSFTDLAFELAVLVVPGRGPSSEKATEGVCYFPF